MLDLSIISVSYNTRELLRECLRSIFASRGDFTYEILVVDNRSSDGSPEMVGTEYPQVRVMISPVDGGYAYANNLGLRQSSGRYILLLNPDTVLPADALSQMLSFMEEHPEVGVAGPKLVRADGSLDLACRRSFPTPLVSFYQMTGLSRILPGSPRFGRYNLTYLDPDETAEVDSVVGAFMMVRRQAMEQAGLLDESFFMYGEDLDWAFRIKEKGWKIYYYPKVQVLHYKRESSKQRPLRTSFEFYRSMYIFYRKHYAANTFFLLNWLIVTGILLRGALAIVFALVRPRG